MERERSNMKQIFSWWKFFLTGVATLILFLCADPIVTKAGELYFDEEGSLYMTAREKKASGSVSYKTIGWIIKRYDMPIDIPGQQYVVVTKTSYKPDETDPNDSRYVYSYFKSDKEEILSAVKSVSTEWYNILTNYGDTVYIDSVMTVQNKGIPLGTLYPGGSYTGEVYFTYEGISEARSWASKESIKIHFGIEVRFPIIIKPQTTSYRECMVTPVSITSSHYNGFNLSSDKFELSSGIPSGESLKLKGQADDAIYKLNLEKVDGQVTVAVAVPVKYILKWTDYYGKAREEERTIYKYYYVSKGISYYRYVSLDIMPLEEIAIAGQVTGGSKNVNVGAKPDVGKITSGTVSYGSVKKHVIDIEILPISTTPVEVLTSDTYFKPAIPDTSYSYEAQKALGSVTTISDRVVINGTEILSDKQGEMYGESPKKYISPNMINVNVDNISIPKEMMNGSDYQVNGTLYYLGDDGTRVSYNMSKLPDITVHTPVVCNITINTDKSLNQMVTPQGGDIVLGEMFAISFSDFGNHRDISGYKLNNYSKYVDQRQVNLPFDVIYNGVRYKAGTWINLKSFYEKFTVCEDNTEGTYSIKARTLAYNTPIDIRDNQVQWSANTSLDKYGAYSEIDVRLVGKVHNLTVTTGGESSKAPDLPLVIEESEDNKTQVNSVDISITTVGDVGDSDYLTVEYDYYVEGINGALTPVDVYKVVKRDQLSGEILEKLIDMDIWNRELCSISGNVGLWTKEFQLPGEYIAVPIGTSEEDIKDAIKSGDTKELFIEDGRLVVAAEFTRYKNEIPYIKYINEANGKKGYCNMWLKEGGRSITPYGMLFKIGQPEDSYYDYEISGTH